MSAAVLTNNQAMRVIAAGVLFGRCAEVLSDFERELVREVGQRFVDHKRSAVITEAEWSVLDGALAAMRAEMDRRLADLQEEARTALNVALASVLVAVREIRATGGSLTAVDRTKIGGALDQVDAHLSSRAA